ncbi:AGAP005534-PA-like protein [Anopheles sinensis]|uniref:AGAP005534-PA-like protein n=1 Tax=Anopheles sinensis TaxID=74873 RepID=A0A084WKI3_ANOSI|nr:AGAP005534-PA-like protein [Anopheles sinensis]
MRNCFVYKCDWKHRHNPKRAMFVLPKDPEKFKLWSDVLPKHRRLTHSDRVCEKHFDPADIVRDWLHVIQGETKKLQRSKPYLRRDAVPRHFDLSEAELDAIARKSKRMSVKPERKVEPVEQNLQIETPTEPNPPPQCELNESEASAIFEDIYENIFEIELPSTVWGVHRDPERQYIAFTRFQLLANPESRTSRTLLIKSTLKCCAWYDSQSLFEDDLRSKLAPLQNGEEHSRFNVISSMLDSLEQLLDESQTK